MSIFNYIREQLVLEQEEIQEIKPVTAAIAGLGVVGSAAMAGVSATRMVKCKKKFPNDKKKYHRCVALHPWLVGQKRNKK